MIVLKWSVFDEGVPSLVYLEPGDNASEIPGMRPDLGVRVGIVDTPAIYTRVPGFDGEPLCTLVYLNRPDIEKMREVFGPTAT